MRASRQTSIRRPSSSTGSPSPPRRDRRSPRARARPRRWPSARPHGRRRRPWGCHRIRGQPRRTRTRHLSPPCACGATARVPRAGRRAPCGTGTRAYSPACGPSASSPCRRRRRRRDRVTWPCPCRHPGERHRTDDPPRRR